MVIARLLLCIIFVQLCSALIRTGESRTEHAEALWTSTSALSREADRSAGVALRTVPKIIHQTWKNGKLPPAFQNWSKSWQECLPGWEYRLHTDEDNRNFIKKHFPEFLHTYDSYDLNIKRVDAVRYAYLAVDGGLYVDLDIECLQNPYSLFSHDPNGLWGTTDLTLACESDMRHSCATDGQVSNAFMFAGTEAGKEFFRRVMKRLPKESRNHHVLWATGPQFLTDSYKELLKANMQPSTVGFERVQDFHTKPWSIKRLAKSPVTVTMVDNSLVFDISWDDTQGRLACMNRTKCKERSPHAISVSHWAASWQPQLSTLEVEGKAHTVQHPLEDCFTQCGGGGYCDWCGRGNACCRYQFVYIQEDPKECERAIHFSMPKNHVCVALEKEEGFVYKARPKKLGFLQSATLQTHEMCSCLDDGLFQAKELSQACHTSLNQRLGDELRDSGGALRDGMRKLQELHERLGC